MPVPTDPIKLALWKLRMRDSHRRGKYVICTTCQKQFYRSRTQVKEKNYCSHSCCPVWNKGKKGEYHQSEETVKSSRIRMKKLYSEGKLKTCFKEKSGKLGYRALHNWVERQSGFARDKSCLLCKSIKRVDWANISHEYKKEILDWAPLCRKCHIWYDKNWLDKPEFQPLKKLAVQCPSFQGTWQHECEKIIIGDKLTC